MCQTFRSLVRRPPQAAKHGQYHATLKHPIGFPFQIKQIEFAFLLTRRCAKIPHKNSAKKNNLPAMGTSVRHIYVADLHLNIYFAKVDVEQDILNYV